MVGFFSTSLSLKTSKQFFKDRFTSMKTVQPNFLGFDLDFFPVFIERNSISNVS